ncbi:hypothetical protein LCGC14_1494350 [marine sediment metagenome]|uniref:Uncharacterized protein n=1 Tax=marine sediment metagenome TaxID=412755 RepID=A0A0F9LLC5_9ZZZZ
MYKVKNITSDPRTFREHKTGRAYFLRAGEEVIVSNLPVNKRPDVFEITDLEKKEEKEQSEKPKNFERRFKK